MGAPHPIVDLFGVRITNATKSEAVALLDGWIAGRSNRARSVFIVNAHTLNVAWNDPGYRALLDASDVVFGDGTGVRLAARLKGVAMRDNLVGTDLMPRFFEETRDRGHRCFLLGGSPETADRAAAWIARSHPGTTLAGFRHGYDADGPEVIDQINRARPDILLVGMGNPLQERWIDRHRDRLEVPVSVGVGGLFDHWAGNLRRAPLWVRRLGMEWAQILLQQPRKTRRYLVGNPAFVWRALRDVHPRAALRTHRAA